MVDRGWSSSLGMFVEEIMMKIRLFILTFFLGSNWMLKAQESQVEEGFHIEKVSSGVDYPTKGNEAIDVRFSDRIFHVRIFHPKVIEGPHFSTPFFWTSVPEEPNGFDGYLTLATHFGGLSWHSINGYFFAETDADFWADP